MVFHNYFETTTMCLIVAALLATPTVCVSNLKTISCLSCLLILLIDIVMIIFIILSLINVKHWSYTDIKWVDMKGLPVSNVIVLYTFVCHPYLPKIESAMLRSDNYNTISTVSFALSAIIKIVFGTLLALNYGSSMYQSVSRNIRSELLKFIVTSFLGFFGYLSLPLVLNVAVSIFENVDITFMQALLQSYNQQGRGEWRDTFIKMGVKLAFLGVVLLLTVGIPEFSMMTAVMGSVTAVLVTIIFPAYFYKSIKLKQWTFSTIFLVAYGVFSTATGLYFSLFKIIITYLR